MRTRKQNEDRETESGYGNRLRTRKQDKDKETE